MEMQKLINLIEEVENQYLDKKSVLIALRNVNKKLVKKETMNQNIVNYMERWCLGRDEDEEALANIKKELIKNNLLLWHK